MRFKTQHRWEATTNTYAEHHGNQPKKKDAVKTYRILNLLYVF